jgi:hypothetical protein
VLAHQVISQTADTIELDGDIVIEVATCSYRTVRGRSVCVALLDEVAFWRSESAANPDKEVWRAIRPSMASFGSEALAVIASSPYARRGLMWESFKKFYGKPDAQNLSWQASTKQMNPTISDDFLAEEFEADPASAEGEYNAQFRTDIESFVSREVVDAAVVVGRYELAPVAGVSYCAFTDPSGGSVDSMTLAIAHRDTDGRLLLDALRERRAPAPTMSPRSTRIGRDRCAASPPDTRIGESSRWSSCLYRKWSRYRGDCPNGRSLLRRPLGGRRGLGDVRIDGPRTFGPRLPYHIGGAASCD